MVLHHFHDALGLPVGDEGHDLPVELHEIADIRRPAPEDPLHRLHPAGHRQAGDVLGDAGDLGIVGGLGDEGVEPGVQLHHPLLGGLRAFHLLRHGLHQPLQLGHAVLHVGEGQGQVEGADVHDGPQRHEIPPVVLVQDDVVEETTRAIFGVDPKDSGEFYVDGKKIEVNCPMDAIRNGVVLAPEDRKKDGLCTKLSIRQNLALPNLDLVCNKMGVINSGKEDALCEKAVKDLQIKTPNVEIDSGNLSGGNQQKVVVGKWLARDSRVVIFDEPTRGIDVGAKVEIYNLMNELKKQGIAVMFVSSEMPEVMGIADRIIVMCDGRITGEVSAREATQDEILTMATSFENKSIKETEGGSKNE